MASWIGVITDVGTKILAESTLGHTICLCNAYAGSGTVADDELRSLSSVTKTEQELGITGYAYEDESVKVRLQIQASDYSYKLCQIGLYARIDDNEPGLMAIFQNKDGVHIPSKSESPSFLFRFNAILAVSNQANISVQISPETYVTSDTLDERIEKTKDEIGKTISILEQAFSEHSQTSGSHFENLYGAIGNLQTVDSQLSSAIAAEQSARVQADNVHNQQINSLNEAVAAHNTHIINLITSIQDLSKVDGTLNTAIIDETTTRQKADEAMDERIKTLEDTINGFINVSEDGA